MCDRIHRLHQCPPGKSKAQWALEHSSDEDEDLPAPGRFTAALDQSKVDNENAAEILRALRDGEAPPKQASPGSSPRRHLDGVPLPDAPQPAAPEGGPRCDCARMAETECAEEGPLQRCVACGHSACTQHIWWYAAQAPWYHNANYATEAQGWRLICTCCRYPAVHPVARAYAKEPVAPAAGEGTPGSGTVQTEEGHAQPRGEGAASA